MTRRQLFTAIATAAAGAIAAPAITCPAQPTLDRAELCPWLLDNDLCVRFYFQELDERGVSHERFRSVLHDMIFWNLEEEAVYITWDDYLRVVKELSIG